MGREGKGNFIFICFYFPYHGFILLLFIIGIGIFQDTDHYGCFSIPRKLS